MPRVKFDQLAAPAAAPPPPPSMMPASSPADDVRGTVSAIRQGLELVKELRGLAGEARPFLEMLRAPQPEVVPADHPAASFREPPLPRPRIPTDRQVETWEPPREERAPQVKPSQDETAEAAREEMRAAIRRLPHGELVKLVIFASTWATTDRLPSIAQFLEEHADAVERDMLALPDDKLKAAACALVALVPDNDAPYARALLVQAAESARSTTTSDETPAAPATEGPSTPPREEPTPTAAAPKPRTPKKRKRASRAKEPRQEDDADA